MNDYIYFYLPGIAETFEINFMLLKRMNDAPDHFYPNVKIGGVFGSIPGAIWNGGRLNLGYITDEKLDYVIEAFREMEIPLRWTWTNPTITEEELEDEYCNLITKKGEDGINEVLVNNDLMENYIRSNYPSYPIISSTTKRITDIDALNEELRKDYRLVVIDYDFNNRWEYLNQIEHPEKCEILINALCTPHCPLRKRHYEVIGQKQKGNMDVEDAAVEECMSQYRLRADVKKLPHFVSVESIWEDYVPRGFRHFKIEGRTVCPVKPLEWYLYYMVKPEYQDIEREYLELGLETACYMPNIPVFFQKPDVS
jgi:hypothetical protein